jgi:hypothetical protein
MQPKDSSVPISQFKVACLRLKGRPIAKVSPIEHSRVPIRGSWKDQVETKGDIVHFSVKDDWEGAS